jgi:hypothetical protein
LALVLNVEPALLVDAELRLTVVNDNGSRPVEDESRTVRPKGLEPPTFWIGVSSPIGDALAWELAA